jgi:glycopeptide antibiotics resistance protein
MNRNRFIYSLLIGFTIIAGLASRHFPQQLPHWVHAYLGDTLWALMVFLLIGFVFKRKSTRWVALAAIVFSFCIELSQLYHAPWIDALRANRLGGLILGFGFLWSDLICYSVGVAIGYVGEKIFSPCH